MEQLGLGVFWYAVFLFSVTLHEAAHAFVAHRGGDATAHHGGQVTLDPLPHIRRSPFGMVVLPILSLIIAGWPFGFASAPYDPGWAQRHPRRAAAMALAGPLSNLLLVVVMGTAIRLGMQAGLFYAPESIDYTRVTLPLAGGTAMAGLAILLSMFFSLNLILFLLNLIPVPPLDGFASLPLILGRGQTQRLRELQRMPGIGWIGILVAWHVFPHIFDPIFTFTLQLLYPDVRYG